MPQGREGFVLTLILRGGLQLTARADGTALDEIDDARMLLWCDPNLTDTE